MSPRAWTCLLSLPVTISLGTLLVALSARFVYMTGGYGVATWWVPSGDAFIDGVDALAVDVLHWLIPLLVLTLVKRRLKGERTARTLIFRIEETRQLYAYFTVGFFIFLFLHYWFYLYDLVLLPIVYIAFPAVAYSNLLRPTKGRATLFAPGTPPIDSDGAPLAPSFTFWMRVIALSASFAAAGFWVVLELHAPFWPRDSLLAMLETATTISGTSGFAILVGMFLLQGVKWGYTSPKSRAAPGRLP